MNKRSAGAISIALGTILALAVTAVPATAQDALICRKRDKQGDKSGGVTHLRAVPELATGPGTARVRPKKNGRGNVVHLRAKGKKGVYYNGGDGNDKIFGTPRHDIIDGGRGHDVVHGQKGNDVVCGGLDNDKVYGDAGDDEVYGEEQNDYLVGGPGNDYMIGQAGRDRLIGYGKQKGQYVADGNDFMEGTFESDVLVVGGFDIAYGGADRDRISSKTPYEGAERLDGGLDNDIIYGSESSDKLIYGDTGDDIIHGLGGDDTIRGGNNDDTIFGDAGNDQLFGELGKDDLSGGPDDDLCDGDENPDRADDTCERKVDIP
jgi:Ca2+-binding RTX toxin-like protein